MATESKKIEGVVAVEMAAFDRQLTLRFDRRVTTRERVTAALQAVLDSVEQ
ncbi:MAG TPA: hypothetical protein VJP45_10590 [Candidatus Limnocylindria bacterium]|nr:hypothetical protein [Candidatus Limnocylindria bacterium]